MDHDLRDECGATSAETVAVLVLVAALVAAVFSVGLPDRVGAEAQRASDCLFTTEPDCRPSVGTHTGVPAETTSGATPPGTTDEDADGPAHEVREDLVAAAFDAIEQAAHPAWYRPPWLRRDDARDVADALYALNGAELDAVLQGLSDAELRELFVTLGRLPESERRALLTAIGTRVDLDTWRRLGAFTEDIDPDPSRALPDSARDDADQDDRDFYDALVYAPFDGPLSARGDDDDHPMADTDFAQGQIGDCYLITAMLAVIYEDPELLASMFVRNPNGTYTVTFADGTSIVVGPDFPVHPDRPDRPVFARDVGGDAAPETELYPLLLEKAYAQYHGGWDDIVGGWPAVTIETMLGGSYETIEHGEVTLADLGSWTDGGQPVTIGTKNDPRDPDDPSDDYPDDWPVAYTDGRLAHQHAYVVTGVDTTSGEVLLVNPWHPTRDPVRLTLDEFRDAMRRVDVTTLP